MMWAWTSRRTVVVALVHTLLFVSMVVWGFGWHHYREALAVITAAAVVGGTFARLEPRIYRCANRFRAGCACCEGRCVLDKGHPGECIVLIAWAPVLRNLMGDDEEETLSERVSDGEGKEHGTTRVRGDGSGEGSGDRK